jgi:hypothetical protein
MLLIIQVKLLGTFLWQEQNIFISACLGPQNTFLVKLAPCSCFCLHHHTLALEALYFLNTQLLISFFDIPGYHQFKICIICYSQKWNPYLISLPCFCVVLITSCELINFVNCYSYFEQLKHRNFETNYVRLL